VRTKIEQCQADCDIVVGDVVITTHGFAVAAESVRAGEVGDVYIEGLFPLPGTNNAFLVNKGSLIFIG
jgi:predicted RecA/RadA family phage recombinase